MPEDFIQLLYLSNAKPELKQEELDSILRVSRANNPSQDITGLLVFANGVFIQVLEGPEKQSINYLRQYVTTRGTRTWLFWGNTPVKSASLLSGLWAFSNQPSMNLPVLPGLLV